jgi:hypothetical protein
MEDSVVYGDEEQLRKLKNSADFTTITLTNLGGGLRPR